MSWLFSFSGDGGKTGPPYAAQVGLKLLDLRHPPVSSFEAARTRGVYHCAQLKYSNNRKLTDTVYTPKDRECVLKLMPVLCLNDHSTIDKSPNVDTIWVSENR